MILAKHVARILGGIVAYGVSTRKASLVILVVIGLVLVALAFVTQVAAPIIVYPFA